MLALIRAAIELIHCRAHPHPCSFRAPLHPHNRRAQRLIGQLPSSPTVKLMSLRSILPEHVYLIHVECSASNPSARAHPPAYRLPTGPARARVYSTSIPISCGARPLSRSSAVALTCYRTHLLSRSPAVALTHCRAHPLLNISASAVLHQRVPRLHRFGQPARLPGLASGPLLAAHDSVVDARLRCRNLCGQGAACRQGRRLAAAAARTHHLSADGRSAARHQYHRIH
jgi:hypothetical protein